MERVSKAKYCLDTYALIEIFAGNVHFKDITEEPIIISDPTLVEFWDVLARKHGVSVADKWYAFFELDSVAVPHDILREAIRLKRAHKELNFSMVDATGYCLARHLEVSFVTGDESFRALPGVMFRKKA